MTESLIKKMKGPVSNFILEHYKHFNAASLVDAARAYETQLQEGHKMMITMAGAMSTADLGKSLAEMIRQDKVYWLWIRQSLLLNPMPLLWLP